MLADHPATTVRALMETPRRQAERARRPARRVRAHAMIAVAAAWALLPDYLGQHVLLSACALALGLAISLPLALPRAAAPPIRWPSLFAASLIQTIPSLALLALFYPLLLALSALTRPCSASASRPWAFCPLAAGADALFDAADPAEHRRRHRRRRSRRRRGGAGHGHDAAPTPLLVELPLAAPVIMAGVRTAAVWTIGAATLATPVGQT